MYLPVRIYLTQLRKKSQGVINKKFLPGPGAVFSKRAPGRRRQSTHATAGFPAYFLDNFQILFL